MNKLFYFAPAALALASGAPPLLAQEAESDAWRDVVQEAYRAGIAAAVATAPAAAPEASPAVPQPAAKTRAQVRAELMLARLTGELDAINAEAYMGAPFQAPPVRLAQKR